MIEYKNIYVEESSCALISQREIACPKYHIDLPRSADADADLNRQFLMLSVNAFTIDEKWTSEQELPSRGLEILLP